FPSFSNGQRMAAGYPVPACPRPDLIYYIRKSLGSSGLFLRNSRQRAARTIKRSSIQELPDGCTPTPPSQRPPFDRWRTSQWLTNEESNENTFEKLSFRARTGQRTGTCRGHPFVPAIPRRNGKR